jgi:uncharacterized protein (TIGR02594 family)
MTLYEHAHQFRGMREIPGDKHHPWIVWSFTLCGLDATDEDAWCSAAMNGWAYGVPRCPRTFSARARSWLFIGTPIHFDEARIGWDVLIFKRGAGPQPGANVLAAPGHVGLFAGLAADDEHVLCFGGNQSNEAKIARMPIADLLGVRRLNVLAGNA